MALSPHNKSIIVQTPNPPDTCDLDDLQSTSFQSLETTSDVVSQRQSFYSAKTTLTNASSKQHEHVSNTRAFSPQKSLSLNRFLGYTVVNLPTQGTPSPDIEKPSNNLASSRNLNKIDVTLMIILCIGSVYLVVTSALATPVLRLSSLSVHKFNDSSSSGDADAKLSLAGTWDVKLMIQNVEMWKGSYSVTNCTLYVQIEKRSYYEEEARNLIVAAESNGIVKDSFYLKPKEEKELRLRMNDVGAREEHLESTSFALIVSVHVSFGHPKHAGLASGMAYYECGGLTMDTRTSMMSNDVPILCHLTAPLFK